MGLKQLTITADRRPKANFPPDKCQSAKLSSLPVDFPSGRVYNKFVS
jgi:hypothetical protein